MIAFGDRQLFATVVFNRLFSYAGSFRDWGFGCRMAAMRRNPAEARSSAFRPALELLDIPQCALAQN
jgi:hypothetical protein